MKKNLMSVIILALVFANFILTALLVFTVLPQTKKANKLIEDVCAAIDLDLNSGKVTGTSNVPMEQIEVFKLNNGETTTLSFAQGEDGKAHYLVASISISINNKSDNYSVYGSDLTSKESLIASDINNIIGKYTMEQYLADKDSVRDEILKDLQNMFGSDFIVGVNFASSLTQ